LVRAAKRQRTGALQDASRFKRIIADAQRLGVRRPSAAFSTRIINQHRDGSLTHFRFPLSAFRFYRMSLITSAATKILVRFHFNPAAAG
jgi:hypothetical protein